MYIFVYIYTYLHAYIHTCTHIYKMYKARLCTACSLFRSLRRHSFELVEFCLENGLEKDIYW